ADGIDERFVVCNGDILTSLDLGAIVAFHDAHGAEATISLSEVEDPSAFGVVPTRPDGQVIAFVEKPRRENAPSRWINAGTYVLEPRFLDRIPPRLNVSIERETFPRVLEQPGALFAYKSDAYWLDIGTPEKYIQANTDVLDGKLDGGAGAARGGGAALVGAGSVVSDTASVHAAALGTGVVVDEAASIGRSVVMNGAHIGKGARLDSTIIGPDAVVEAGAVLSDFTIVGANAVVAAGSRLSAARISPSEGSV
ncbi:MAG: mannose-phosphate guanylyltransferase, partial [Actinomycetota bacterium]|nr:mannose-phosphate guanylyltransferase [Actinomycetota bacterium]